MKRRIRLACLAMALIVVLLALALVRHHNNTPPGYQAHRLLRPLVTMDRQMPWCACATGLLHIIGRDRSAVDVGALPFSG